MSDRDVRKLAKIVADHSRQIKGLSGGPQAAYSSIEGGSMDAYDNDGKMRLRIGAQDDGTHAVKYVQGPPPPRPTVPVVSVDGPVVRVRWDGMLLGGHIPEDFARIDVHFALASDDLEADEAVRGNLATSAGNEAVLAATSTGTYRVGLVAMSQSRARSEMSEVVDVDVTLVDIEGALDAVVENARGGSNHYRPVPPPGTDHDPDRDLWFDTSVDAEGLVSYSPHRWDESLQEWVSLEDERTQAIQVAQREFESVVTEGLNDVQQTAGNAQQSADDAMTEAEAAREEATSKAQAAQQAAEAHADAVAEAERLAAIAAASDDASAKAAAAQAAAEATAAADASAKAQAAQQAAEAKAQAAHDTADDAMARADEAHTRAGDAETAAGAAMQAATHNAKNLWSTANPSGTAPRGTIWFKIDPVTRNVVGQWQQTAGSDTAFGSNWEKRQLTDALFDNIDAGKINTGYLDVAALIRAGAIQADKLLIGGSENMLPVSGLDSGSTLNPHEALGGRTAQLFSNASAGREYANAIWLRSQDIGAAGVWADAMAFNSGGLSGAVHNGQSFPSKVGQQLRVDSYVLRRGSEPDGHVGARVVLAWFNYQGVEIGRVAGEATRGIYTPDLQMFVEGTAPAGVSYVRVLVQIDRRGDVALWRPRMIEQKGAVFIGAGAINTPHLAAASITGESGILANLDAGVISYGFMSGARLEAGSVDTPQLAFGAATGDILSVDALNFKTAVGLDIRGSSFRAGDAVEMTEDFGIRQFGPDGALNVSLPSDGSEAQFRGDLSAKTLTATGRMSIQGPGAIASDGVLELESGVVPPVAGPQVTNVWDRTTFPPLTEQEAPAGLAWADGHFWRCVTTSVSLSDGGRTRIEKISPTGELVGGWDTTFRVGVDGITILNGELYVLAWWLSVSGDDSTPNRPRMMVVYNLQGVEQRRWEYPNYGSGTWQPGIGNDGTDIVIAQSWANGDHSYRTFSPTTGATIRRYDTGFVMRSNVTQILFGDFDYADGRKKIIAQQRTDLKAFVCYDEAETSPNDAARSWNAADFQNPVGLAWDGARFHSLTATGDLVSYQSHETNRFIGDDENDWWGAVTWVTGSQETTAGPATRFRYLHRAQLRVQNGDVPAGVEAARFYTSKGTSEPDRTDLQWRATSEQPHEPLRVTSISSFSGGTNPPATNSFTTDAPGEIHSALGNFRVDGTGAGSWGPLAFQADGSMTGIPKIAHGTVLVTGIPNEATGMDVTLPTGLFTQPPTVVATLNSGNLTSAQNVGVNPGTTKDTFRIVLLRTNDTGTYINWVATGE